MPANDRPDGGNQGPDRPDYKVYRSRRGIFGKRADDSGRVAPPRQKTPAGPAQPSTDEQPVADYGAVHRGGGGSGARPPKARGRWPFMRIVKWVGIAALAWLLLSFAAFLISSQIQAGKLHDSAKKPLAGGPLMALSPQTILILGTDVRSGQFAGPAEAASKFCLEAAGSGRKPPLRCDAYRSDTIMLLRAGGGKFNKLSIPRDTLANIPGRGPDKINAAYAYGGAQLSIRTVSDFLGVDIDQVAILDFDGFRAFIDSIGGVEVDLPTRVCTSQSGGAFKLDLKKGTHNLNGYQAITLARTRDNSCSTGENAGRGDIERAQFQQVIISGIQNSITDPKRLPLNFIKGPWIGWNAPKTMVSSMGAWTMPQLVFSAAIGGGGETGILEPTVVTPAGNLFVPLEECDRAVREFLGDAPDRTPACSPTP